jgi:FemAB-related protein (PEP-CTERM system-associated)
MSATDIESWDAYVQNHPAGTVFHSMAWQDILQKTYQKTYYHIAVKLEGKLQGIVSLYSVRSLGGSKNLYSLPYTAYGGILSNDPSASRLLHDECLAIAKRENAGMVNLRNTAPTGLELPTSELNVQFIKALPQTEEACLEAIPRKSRATVRKSMLNHGLSYEVNGDWDLLWHLSAVNLKKLGTPAFPKKFYRNIMERMGDKADILFVKYQGKAICGVMTFYFKNVCNPYFSGALGEYNFTGANNYMYYALMCHGLKRHCQEFDFGKSRRGSGSFDFKKNMGFEPRTLPFQYIFNTKQEISTFNPSNPKLALFLKTWSSQPLWTSKIIGPVLNRFLP